MELLFVVVGVVEFAQYPFGQCRREVRLGDGDGTAMFGVLCEFEEDAGQPRFLPCPSTSRLVRGENGPV